MPELSFEKHKPHPWKHRSVADIHGDPASEPPRAASAIRYAELAVTSNFTFLTGASHPEELVQTAASLGHTHAAIADLHTLAGVVRAHVAAKDAGIPIAIGTRIQIPTRCHDASRPCCLLLFSTDRASYARLCRLLTTGKRRAPKGECHLTLHDLLEFHQGLLAIVQPPQIDGLTDDYINLLQSLARTFDDDRLSIAACRDYGPDDSARLAQIDALCTHLGVPMVATNDVLYHDADRKPLQDVLTCIRHGCTIDEAGLRLQPRAERCLKPPAEMARLFTEYPHAITRSADIAERSARGFTLDQLRYEYPDEVVPTGRTPMEYLAELVWQGAAERLAKATEGGGGDQSPKETTDVQHSELPRPHRVAEEHGSGSNGLQSNSIDAAVRAVGPDQPDEASGGIGFLEHRRGTWSAESAGRSQAPEDRPRLSGRTDDPGRTGEQSHHASDESSPGRTACGGGPNSPRPDPQLGKQGSAIELVSGSVPSSLRRSVAPSLLHQLLHELALINELNYAPYFLTVHDLVRYARSRGILCQGRGAAANSAVCYCLGVTSVDPSRIDLLFERFISKERNEPPDIDIDFEHERREEVIQYIYAKYGRERAALTAEVITYRGRSAIRDVGKALGLSLDCVDRLAKQLDWWERGFAGEDDDNEQEEKRKWEKEDGHRTGTGAPGSSSARASTGHKPHPDTWLGDHPRREPQWPAPTNWPLSIPQHPEKPQRPVANDTLSDRLRDLGMNPDDPTIRLALRLAGEILGFPRHLSQHVGGFVMTRGPLCESVPIENARMPDRTVIEWDKDDIEAVGMLKVDVLGLGMLTAISKALAFVNQSVQRSSSVFGSEGATVCCRGWSEAAPGRRAEPPESRDPLTPSPSYRIASSPHHPPLALNTIPPEDPRVYDMICHADTVGVFQIESRAQMSMLPRLKPRNFYDLVIEVAIVRPGPIVGDMVHPYLKRRNGEEEPDYPDDAVKAVLGKTLGVPLFQEQAMKLAMVAAGFTAGEADQLRRAIAAWKTKQKLIHSFGKRIVEGMTGRGYPLEFALRCFEQLKGFSEYGFPESHAASFALLVYASAWLKCYHPAEFAAAIINSQPMGFYAPAQLVRDAKEHGVEVREIDVNLSGWDCRIEHAKQDQEGTQRNGRAGSSAEKPSQASSESSESVPLTRFSPLCSHLSHSSEFRLSRSALRLGMRLVDGLRESEARLIESAIVQSGSFSTITALWRTSGVKVSTLRRLAHADAFRSMGLDRQHALWEVRSLKDEHLPLFDSLPDSLPSSLRRSVAGGASLPTISPSRHVIHDYESTGLSLRAHPVSFIRDHLDRRHITRNNALKDQQAFPHGARVAVAGVVLVRQRPSTASGVVFMTIEDETGVANLIVWPQIYKKFRKAARHSVVITVRGRVQRDGEVVHVLVTSIVDTTEEVAGLDAMSRDFR